MSKFTRLVSILLSVVLVCACASQQTSQSYLNATSPLALNTEVAEQTCGLSGIKSVTISSFECHNKTLGQNKPYRQGWVMPADYDYPDTNTIKIISWNVEHFVDEFDDPYVDNRRENTFSHMANKRAYLVTALKQANADVVVLQEFESAKLLRDLANAELADMGYRFFADAPSHTWYMNVVVMSRVPLGVMHSYGNLHTPVVDWMNEEGNTESQNRLNTRTWAIEVYPSEDYSFVMSAVHLKAGRSERDVGMRLGQIKMLKAQFDRFLNEDRHRNILLLGDFNALPNTAELNAILRGTTDGNTFIDPLSDDVFTHPANEPVRRLDYAVLNKNMITELVPNSAKVVSYFESDQQDALADHLPVVLEINLND